MPQSISRSGKNNGTWLRSQVRTTGSDCKLVAVYLTVHRYRVQSAGNEQKRRVIFKYFTAERSKQHPDPGQKWVPG